MKNYFLLKDFMCQYRWFYVLGIFCLVVVDILQLFIPEILRNFTDLISSKMLNRQLLRQYVINIILLSSFIGLGRYFWRIYIMGTAREMEYYLRDKIFKHLQNLSLNYFIHKKTGDLMARTTNDIQTVRMAMGMGIVMITDGLFLTLSILFRMFTTIDTNLVLLALVPLPLLVLLLLLFKKEIHNRFKDVQSTYGILTEKVQENVSGIRVIKIFDQEELEVRKFSKVNLSYFNRNVSLVKIQGAFHPLIAFISSISSLLSLWYGSILVTRGSITLGDFVAFTSYLAMLNWPIMALGRTINIFQRGSVSMGRINEILDTKPDIYENIENFTLDHIHGNIKIQNLSFKYPNSNIYALKDIDIDIPQGKFLGIIGSTGSGKSTLVNLILRLYEVQEGTITIDNMDIRLMPLKFLRGNMGIVEQDNFLFSTTIHNNISFGDNNISMKDIVASTKISQIHNDIIGFPNGYNTNIGERGITLSGGQKQRICIARAILTNPSIFIMDDGLSSVDMETEKQILEGLEKNFHQCTRIFVSHRISTIKHCNEIVVLNNGKIIERGNHDSLLQQRGYYYSLYKKQILEEHISIE